MFDIAFLTERSEPQDGGWLALRGRIVLRDFGEDFLAALEPWNAADYQRHWVDAARRLLRDGRTGFVTSAFQFWWVMWANRSEIIVQQQLLLDLPIDSPHDLEPLFAGIGKRRATAEGEDPVSEWQLKREEVEKFLDRRSARYESA